MSEKELALSLLERIPEYKLGYVIAYLRGLDDSERADDEFCAQLLESYQTSADKGEFVPFEEAARMCGVDVSAIQD